MQVLTSKIRNLSFLSNKALLEDLTPSISGNVYNIINPYDNSIITTIPDMDHRDTASAISSANAIFPEWKSTTAMVGTNLF